ncbi:MAG: hypothetical protein KGP12_01055 [Actinomycetales bacterium]|nr:hypothetical protein [Actinomycetales bacterium]
MSMTDAGGDAADQAERLVMTREAEAVHAGLSGRRQESSDEDLGYPLEDLEEVLAMEDADDASDDPMHAGGLLPRRWVTAEEAAMHVIAPAGQDEGSFAAGASDVERADPARDQFDGIASPLTPEDETLLGIDPYE